MTRRALLVRILVMAAGLGSQGVLCQSGPDCSDACEKVQECPTLNKTFFLSCSTLGPSCLDDRLANCALCILESSTTCAELVAGKCDQVCVPDFDAGTAVEDGGSPDAGPSNDAGN